MKEDIISVAILLFFIGVVLAFYLEEPSQPTAFDCRSLIGNWHPDLPRELLEKCKKGVA
jgi:hypothetical protein